MTYSFMPVTSHITVKTRTLTNSHKLWVEWNLDIRLLSQATMRSVWMTVVFIPKRKMLIYKNIHADIVKIKYLINLKLKDASIWNILRLILKVLRFSGLPIRHIIVVRLSSTIWNMMMLSGVKFLKKLMFLLLMDLHTEFLIKMWKMSSAVRKLYKNIANYENQSFIFLGISTKQKGTQQSMTHYMQTLH